MVPSFRGRNSQSSLFSWRCEQICVEFLWNIHYLYSFFPKWSQSLIKSLSQISIKCIHPKIWLWMNIFTRFEYAADTTWIIRKMYSCSNCSSSFYVTCWLIWCVICFWCYNKVRILLRISIVNDLIFFLSTIIDLFE